MTLLHSVFDTISEGILIVDGEDRVIYNNKRFLELWRIPPELAKAGDDRVLLRFIGDQLLRPDAFFERVRALYRDRVTETLDEIEFVDGRFFERSSKPLHIEGQWQGRIWAFRDVTEQRKGKVLFSAVADLSPDIISLIGVDGTLTFNSQAAERIHGYLPEELVGQNTFDLIHPEDQAKVGVAMAQLLATPGALVRVQYRFRNKDRTYSWIEATAVNQLENPLVRSLVVISREINQQKQLEESLNQALKLRDDFISITSHELKTPLTSIKLQLQMLLRSAEKAAPAVPLKHQNIAGLLDQVNALQRLIEDLLSVTRIRTGKLELDRQREDLGALIRNHFRSYEPLFEEACCPVRLDVADGIFVNCDRYRIEQVLHNLYANAMKYSRGCPVEVRLAKAGTAAVISVRDHGPGIPPEKQERIFRLFERGTHSPNLRGLGIGLFISRTIVEEHHGTLALESAPDAGATFSVSLPLA
jgi:PAS domain S-box-containing protein